MIRQVGKRLLYAAGKEALCTSLGIPCGLDEMALEIVADLIAESS